MRTKDAKYYFKKAYRLARCPDMIFANDLIIDFPVSYLILALKCVDFKC